MDILLTADLHSKLTWFRWLESQAEKYELIGIAGDFLDLFSSVDPKTQSIAATVFLRRLSGKTKVAVCSGNHDRIDYLANTRVAAPLSLSELHGISKTAVRNYLEGGEPGVTALRKLCKAMGLNVQWVVDGDGPKYKISDPGTGWILLDPTIG